METSSLPENETPDTETVESPDSTPSSEALATASDAPVPEEESSTHDEPGGVDLESTGEAPTAESPEEFVQSFADRLASLAAPGGVVGEREESDGALRDHRGTIFAKLFETETAVAGRTRWSVGTSRRTCVGCGEALHDDVSFHTALCPPGDVSLDSPLIAEASEVFERRDYCESCFDREPPAGAFAHWKTVLPPPPDAPKKIVNLASLRVYFDQLGAVIDRAKDSDDDSDLSPQDLADVERLRYLIALFLVRKRMLKWVDHARDRLTLDCKATETQIDVAVPPPGAEMDAATRAFEQIFG